MSAGDGFGDPETGRAAAIGGMIDETALALDQFVDQAVGIMRLIMGGFVHWSSPPPRLGPESRSR